MRFVKERKHGSTLHILHSAGNFKYVLIGEGLAAGLCAGLIAVLYRIILGYAEDFVAAAVAFIRISCCGLLFCSYWDFWLRSS